MQIKDSFARDDARPFARRRRWPACAAVVLALVANQARAGEVHLGWIGDFATVVDGGLDQDERHFGLVELAYDHVFALRDREIGLHVSAQHLYGGGFSADVVGDLQAVSNVDADEGTRVLEAWLDIPLATNLSTAARLLS